MKKIILTILLIVTVFAIKAQDERIHKVRENILLYADTNILIGNDTLIRSVYGFLPLDVEAGDYQYEYRKIYWLNSEIILNIPENFNPTPTDSLLLFGQMRSYDWIYPQVKAIDTANWKIAAWQTYLQKINNQ